MFLNKVVTKMKANAKV